MGKTKYTEYYMFSRLFVFWPVRVTTQPLSGQKSVYVEKLKFVIFNFPMAGQTKKAALDKEHFHDGRPRVVVVLSL
jgi:hypothetical protein